MSWGSVLTCTSSCPLVIWSPRLLVNATQFCLLHIVDLSFPLQSIYDLKSFQVKVTAVWLFDQLWCKTAQSFIHRHAADCQMITLRRPQRWRVGRIYTPKKKKIKKQRRYLHSQCECVIVWKVSEGFHFLFYLHGTAAMRAGSSFIQRVINYPPCNSKPFAPSGQTWSSGVCCVIKRRTFTRNNGCRAMCSRQ